MKIAHDSENSTSLFFGQKGASFGQRISDEAEECDK
jgi:hypothetical protein